MCVFYQMETPFDGAINRINGATIQTTRQKKKKTTIIRSEGTGLYTICVSSIVYLGHMVSKNKCVVSEGKKKTKIIRIMVICVRT